MSTAGYIGAAVGVVIALVGYILTKRAQKDPNPFGEGLRTWMGLVIMAAGAAIAVVALLVGWLS